MQSTKKLLTPEQLRQLAKECPEWALEDNKLSRYCSFPDFVETMVFVNRVAELAEECGHHPDFDIRFNCVRLMLSSHDAGGLTARDADMARDISDLYGLGSNRHAA